MMPQNHDADQFSLNFKHDVVGKPVQITSSPLIVQTMTPQRLHFDSFERGLKLVEKKITRLIGAAVIVVKNFPEIPPNTWVDDQRHRLREARNSSRN